MFNSNLTSSISGWFTDTFQSKEEENSKVEEENSKVEDENEVETKTAVKSDQVKHSSHPHVRFKLL